VQVVQGLHVINLLHHLVVILELVLQVLQHLLYRALIERLYCRDLPQLVLGFRIKSNPQFFFDGDHWVQLLSD
jgi:hypothetical protein